MTFLQRIEVVLFVALAPSAFGQFQITTASLPEGGINTVYSASVASNGDEGTTWSASGLAPGLSINPGPGTTTTITGTPTQGGTFAVTIQAFDAQFEDLGTVTKQFTLNIVGIVNSSPLPNGMVGVTYFNGVQIIGGGGTPPYTFNSFPPLAGGLSLSSSGLISGTPIQARTLNFNIAVTDAKGASGVEPFELVIVPQLLITTTSPLPNAVAGVSYTQTINATGGTMPYTFSLMPGSGAPAGLAISANGGLSWPTPAIGTYNFTVQVADNSNPGFTATQQFQLTVAASAPLLQVSPTQLTFSAVTGGDAPPPQSVSILTTGQAPVNFTAMVESSTVGAANVPPAWLTIVSPGGNPASGQAPGSLIVRVNQAGLTAPSTGSASFTATIQISVPNNTTVKPFSVAVTLLLSTGAPQLQVVPTLLRFGANIQTPGALEQAIAIDNTGGGAAVSFTAGTVAHSPWITGVTPASGQAGPNSPALLKVDVNTQGLAVGNYHDVIQITSSAGSISVPVSLFISAQGPVIAVDVTGLRFQARQGAGLSQTKTVRVLNLGSSGTTVNWTADLPLGSPWLTLGTSTGVSTAGNPGILQLSPNSTITGYTAGGYYALVRVADAQSLNSPQYVVAVVDIEPASSPALPDPSPAGLFFSNSVSSTPATQTINVYTSSTTAVPFEAAAVTTDGANWLTATVQTGSASTQAPGSIYVAVNPGVLSGPGVYTGGVNIQMNGVLRTVNVTLVAVPGATYASHIAPLSAPSSGRAEQAQAAAGCASSALALTETSLANNFAVPAGWPATLVVQLNDNCGNQVSNGAAVASFSNGDPPLSLSGDRETGVYTATWQPGVVTPTMTVSVNATAPALTPVTAQFVGSINQNTSSPPTLYPNGALHIDFTAAEAVQLGGGLAPGNASQVYGTGLSCAQSGCSTGTTVPLPTQFNGTFLLVGGLSAPLYYVSPTLINVQIPFELAPNQQYAAIASVNGALTLPETIDLVPMQPGMSAFPDGTVVAQRTSDYSLVTTANPAKPGDSLVIYLAGMGPTNPAVPSGQPTPPQQVPVTNQPTLTIAGQNASIGYAGLTPTGIGLYQINFTVPTSVGPGNQSLVVTQNGISSNTTTLPVGSP